MNNIKNVIIFLSGVVIGGVVSWAYTKKIYEEFNRKEFERFRKEQNGDPKDDEQVVNKSFVEKKTDPAKKAREILKDNGYLDFSSLTFDKTAKKELFKDEEEKKEGEDMKKPYVIHMDDFGEYDDYDKLTYVLYADGVMTDDGGYCLSPDSVDEIVGKDNLKHMGEDFEGLLYVRNDELKLDIEIQVDTRTFDEFEKDNPFIGSSS